MIEATSLDSQRRAVIFGLMTAPMLGFSGCASMRPLPDPEIVGDVPVDVPPILAPQRIVKSPGAPTRVIDVHAHFFNASDVPVAGYLAGPVAHSKSGAVRTLLKALAPIADWLATRAPSAAQEFHALLQMIGNRSLQAQDKTSVLAELDANRSDYVDKLSRELFARLKELPDFVRVFNEAQRENRAALAAMGRATSGQNLDLDEQSLTRAMKREIRQRTLTVQDLSVGEPPAHVEGVLAFLGHMLSYRWMNLRAYQEAFTTEDTAFGVDHVFGSLVDFDHWLTPPLRSAHADQIKVHHLLSRLSGGYMRALAAYNPWSDTLDEGKTLERAINAVTNRGFVGVKIYPPNGFRPFGNAEIPSPVSGAPSGQLLDETLLRMWRRCAGLGVPVMAHSGHSMGSDDASEEMAGPAGWSLLLQKMANETLPRINSGHFGGEDSGNQWTKEFASLMNSPAGRHLHADLGYWEGLRCTRTAMPCAATVRLEESLSTVPTSARRVMFGSDWLMLSIERRWDRYAHDVLAATSGMIKSEDLFAGNADRCFSNAQPPI